ncbi:SDR family oxidoreductase [uncultured Vibrio sp.]|uniref:SDR family oxidoreductase n=1 Tax=uncultured Vibrio sp. TaxID=114054 RepID=UPI0009149A46|nr:SDR family oxidoreductase [uncultured Vibrio sp.]OIQ25324.1 MAG: short-chain dehydrogenase [Vibrio sp. MedPE-SWchi]
MKNVLLVGATSAIAEEVAKIYASDGNVLYLAGRDRTKLENIKADLIVRGAHSVHIKFWNAENNELHQELVDCAFEKLEAIDIAIIAHGSLPNQELCQLSEDKTIDEINTNALSVIRLLTHLANKMEKQGSGSIAVITSVAGDRGRLSNYIYGSAKGMVSIFLQGLSHRLSKSGVHVIDIKPGFVDTPMTKEFKKGVLWTSPFKIARIITNRIKQRSYLAYAPSYWSIIMCIIRNIPFSIIKRTKL